MRGGAVTVLKHLQMEIPNAQRFNEAFDLFYLSAHGATDFSSITIVPEHTFVVFLGISGFIRYVGIHEFPNFLNLMNPEFIDISEGSSRPEGGSTTQQEEYYQRIYDNYITGRTDEYVPYEHSMIYVPGDILPNSEFTFTSDTKAFWAKGLYKLPVSVETAQKLEPQYDENQYIIRVMDLYTRGEIAQTKLDEAQVLPERRDDLMALMVLATSKERIDYLTMSYGPRQWQIFNWFSHPEVLQDSVDLEQFDKGESIYKDMVGFGDNIGEDITVKDLKIELSTLLGQLPTYGTKQYKLLIIGSCRGPIGVRSAYEDALDKILESRYIAPVAGNLPRKVEPVRRLARQFSFSAKQELCASPDEPTFSAQPLKELSRQGGTVIALSREYLEDTRDELPLELIRTINGFFTYRNGFPHYFTKIPMSRFATFLSLLTYPYPILDNTDPKYAPLKIYIQECLRIGRQQFGPFIVQLREFLGEHASASVSIGDLLRTITGLGARSKNTTSEVREQERTVFRNLRTAMGVPERTAQEEEERSAYREWMLMGIDKQLDHISAQTKRFSKVYREALDTLQANTRNAISPENLQQRENRLLTKLLPIRDTLNDINEGFIPELSRRVSAHPAPIHLKLITLLAHAIKVIRQFTELKTQTDQLVKALEQRQTNLTKQVRRQQGTRKLLRKARKTRKSRREKLV